MSLKCYPVYFNRHVFNDKKEDIGILGVGRKMVWAESPQMAELIGKCINDHDNTQWKCGLRCDFVDVGEPIIV